MSSSRLGLLIVNCRGSGVAMLILSQLVHAGLFSPRLPAQELNETLDLNNEVALHTWAASLSSMTRSSLHPTQLVHISSLIRGHQTRATARANGSFSSGCQPRW
jgi:hypothetical protein